MDRPLLKRFFFIFLVIPYLKPAIIGVLEGTELLETGFDVWRLLAALTVTALYFYGVFLKKRRPSAALVLLGGYLFFAALSTALHGTNYWEALNRCLTIFTFCMLLELSLWEDPMVTMDMLYYPLTVLVLANCVLVAMYPLGLCPGGNYNYGYNLLGIDNLLPPILIPYMIFVALRSSMRCGELDLGAYVMLGVSALTILMVWSATGLMGLAVALVFILFFYQRRWETLFNGVTGLLPSFGLFFGVVLFRLQNYFAFFIEGVLHKGLSFTGRTEIWDTAMEKILSSPYLGWGFAQYGKVYRLRKGKYYHAHNVFLEVTMEGGILALLCFLGLLGVAANQLLRHRKHPYACLLSAGLMSWGVMTSMEPFVDPSCLTVYAMIFLCYHVGTLISGKKTAPAGSH